MKRLFIISETLANIFTAFFTIVFELISRILEAASITLISAHY